MGMATREPTGTGSNVPDCDSKGKEWASEFYASGTDDFAYSAFKRQIMAMGTWRMEHSALGTMKRTETWHFWSGRDTPMTEPQAMNIPTMD